MTLKIIKDGVEIIGREESKEYESMELGLLICVLIGQKNSKADVTIKLETISNEKE